MIETVLSGIDMTKGRRDNTPENVSTTQELASVLSTRAYKEFKEKKESYKDLLNTIKEKIDTNEEYKKNYETKKEILKNNTWNLREIQRDEKLIDDEEKIPEISKEINIYIFFEEFEKIFETYQEKEVDNEYIENARTRAKDAIVEKIERKMKIGKKNRKILNKHTWKAIKIARGYTLLLSTASEGKFIRMEMKRNRNFEIYENKDNPGEYKVIERISKNEKKEIDPKVGEYKQAESVDEQHRKLICKKGDFIVQRHIDDHIKNLHDMYKILTKGKNLLDEHFKDRNIRMMFSSSRLFDRKFHEFRLKEREKEGKKDTPNMVRILKELQEKKYGGYLPGYKPEESDFENVFLRKEETSLTKALKKYKEEGNEFKEGGSFIDLDKLKAE